MPDFITLTCPNCSGRLQITDDINRFACMYCGVEHVVRRGGGIVTLQPVVDELKKVNTGISGVKVGVDRTASELAIRRLQVEIPELQRKRQALDGALSSAEKTNQRLGLKDIIWLLVQSAMMWFVALIVVAIAAAIIIDDASTGGLVIMVVPMAVAIWHYYRRQKAVVASRKPTERALRIKAEIDVLDEEIAQAKRELAQHKQLVRQIDN